jgi:cholesterol oxidase
VVLCNGDLDETTFDTIVIGSGFGGSVCAHRLAEAGQRVCVLERGKAHPPGSFPRTPSVMGRNFWDPSEGLHGMFDVWSMRGIEAIVSSGLGGGSLIYANVLIRKDESWFRQPHPYRHGESEAWPIQRADLDDHYGRVERFLRVQEMPAHMHALVPKTALMREAGERIGGDVRWALAPLGVRFDGDLQDGLPVDAAPGSVLPAELYGNVHRSPRRTCRLCGECDIGCNDGAKNTLDHTYLSSASHHGAVISARSEVRSLRRTDRGFDVDFVVHHPDREGLRTATSELVPQTISATRVVVAAGAIGSTFLMLRNREALGVTSPALGTRFCGNGDLLGFVMRIGAGATAVAASAGPVITSYLRWPDAVDTGDPKDLGVYIEDAGYPALVEWLVETSQLVPALKRSARFAIRRILHHLRPGGSSNLSAELHDLLGAGALSSSSMPLLAMGRDVPDGRLYLRDDAGGRRWIDSTWSIDSSERYFDHVRAKMGAIAAALDGHFELNPHYLLRRVITVHPLGGCPMGTSIDDGVVDPFGQVHGVPGLFVADGSVMPGPIGPNPSLTIAAFADRLCDRLVA